MLVSFNLQNYRSFSSPQLFSMVAGTGAKRNQRVSFESGNSLAPNLLRAACLFGGNGAGKSSLVKAIDFFVDFVASSAKASTEGDEIGIATHKFDEEWIGRPSEFEIVFIHEGELYQYGFAVDSKRVWSEWLFHKPRASDTKIRILFQREYEVDTDKYQWKISRSHIKGEKDVWKNSTRSNALFLSTAVQLNADSLRKPFEWIQRYLRVIESPDRLSPYFTARECQETENRAKILQLMKSVGISIQDIDCEMNEISYGDLPQEILANAPDEFKKSKGSLTKIDIKFLHPNTKGASVPLDFGDESDGTQVAFNIAGPWLDVLENGYTLIIDELHNSLHPNALKFLVNLFHDPEINKNNAQLIFTSHETSVMTKGFMHQDQVWLVEKDVNDSSKLVPLSDFKVRDISSFQKAYLDGRYGAVPKLKEFVSG